MSEKVCIKKLKNPMIFIDYSLSINRVYENPEYCLIHQRKKLLLIVFDDMIADIKSNKKLSPIATELLLRQIVSNNLSDTEFKDFMKLYKNYTKEAFSFLVNDKSFLHRLSLLSFSRNLLLLSQNKVSHT